MRLERPSKGFQKPLRRKITAQEAGRNESAHRPAYKGDGYDSALGCYRASGKQQAPSRASAWALAGHAREREGDDNSGAARNRNRSLGRNMQVSRRLQQEEINEDGGLI